MKTTMMIQKICGYAIGVFLLFVAVGLAAPTDASACTVANPAFSPRGDNNSAVKTGPAWYTDSNPPTMNFSVVVADCAGSDVKVELYSGATFIDDFSVSVPDASGGGAKLNASIQLGEQGCVQANTPHCRLSLKAYTDGNLAFNTFSTDYSADTDDIVGYLCDSSCVPSQPFGSINFSPPQWGSDPVQQGNNAQFIRLQNPIQYDNIPDVIRAFITIVFVIGIPLVAFAIIYAGFLLVTAGGSQEKLKKGKQALLAGVIGGAILLGAWVIAEAIQGTIDQIRGV